LSDSGAGLPGCAHQREGLPDAVNIPRMVKPVLEEFDPAGRLLLFCGWRDYALPVVTKGSFGGFSQNCSCASLGAAQRSCGGDVLRMDQLLSGRAAGQLIELPARLGVVRLRLSLSQMRAIVVLLTPAAARVSANRSATVLGMPVFSKGCVTMKMAALDHAVRSKSL
jgi:hypothetical protein